MGAPLPEEVVGLLKAVTLQMNDLFLGLTDEGLIRYASANCTRLIGYDPQELVGARTLAYVHPDDTARATELLDAVIAHGTPLSFQARLRGKSGAYSWWEVQGSPYAIGGERRVFLVARDIDEKLRAQNALAESERLIRRLYEIASDPVSGLEDKLRLTLALGAERFGLPCAIVCRNDVAEPVVVARFGCGQAGPGMPTTVADAIAEAFASGSPCALKSAGAASLCNVIRVGGKPWGTLAFYDTRPTQRDYSDADHDVLNLMTLLVGSTIERYEDDAALRRLALHDSLTDLPNRRLLDDRIDATVAMCKRFKTTCAVLFVDFDRFKSINDELGHATGDAVLREVAHRIVAQLRDVDTLARVGGDEFVALLPQTNTPGAQTVAARIVEAVSRPLRVAHGRSITASIGIAVYARASDSAYTLIERADAAMYKAKSEGRCGIALSA